MPPNRNWTVSVNNAFSSSSDQAVQYREAVFNLKETLQDAGWSIKSSYAGSGSVSAGDTWTSAAGLTYNTAGSGAWIVMHPPGGWPNNPIAIYALLFMDNASADTTPQLIGWRISTDDYTGGTTVALPTTAGVETTSYTSAQLNIIPWTTAVDGRWCSWYTDRGDIMFGIKPKVGTNFRWFFMLLSSGDGDGGGVGNHRWFFWMRSSSSADVLTSTLLSPTTNWRGMRDNGAAAADPEAVAAVWTETATPAFDGSLPVRTMDIISDVNTWGRHLGETVDVYANVTTEAFNTIMESGSPLSLRCIGDISVWVPSAISTS